MLDQSTKRRLMERILSRAFPVIFTQLHPDLRAEILDAVVAGEDVENKFAGAPSDSATLNFLDWVQVIGVAGTLVGVALQIYQIRLEAGKPSSVARADAKDTLQKHELAGRLKPKDQANLGREFDSALDAEGTT